LKKSSLANLAVFKEVKRRIKWIFKQTDTSGEQRVAFTSLRQYLASEKARLGPQFALVPSVSKNQLSQFALNTENKWLTSCGKAACFLLVTFANYTTSRLEAENEAVKHSELGLTKSSSTADILKQVQAQAMKRRHQEELRFQREEASLPLAAIPLLSELYNLLATPVLKKLEDQCKRARELGGASVQDTYEGFTVRFARKMSRYGNQPQYRTLYFDGEVKCSCDRRSRCEVGRGARTGNPGANE
jgi:hypothetical protein